MRLQRSRSKPPLITSQAQSALLGQGVGPTLLGKTCGVSKMAASKWLRGQAVPDDAHAAAIEKVFGVPTVQWRLAPTGGARFAASQDVTPGVTPPAPPVFRVAPPPAPRALPADWARRPGEERHEMLARRVVWLGLDDKGQAPKLTSELDPAEVARRAASIRSRAVGAR
jgi:transcriptional regulator with XRE-family HTH domain